MINQHVFRGDVRCLYPDCGLLEDHHAESAEGPDVQMPHWFIGLRRCGCGFRFNHTSHCLSPAWTKAFLLR